MPDINPSASPVLPLIRECRPGGLRPLLAPGGRDTFFASDVQRMLFPADEPMARFLPPGRWSMPERQERTQEGRAAQIAYTVPDEILKTARPLATLARTEIEAFADAVKAFLAKSQPDAKGVPPYIRQCRADFRLPNPAIDAEAYWVYGPEFDQRLLILWGCEPQAGTSLTLPKLVEQLRAREMSWRDKQELGLKLALRPDEPLARFLARRGQDGGLVTGGGSVPAKKLSRLKTIAPAEWRTFELAAKQYYARAHPGAAGVAPFEQEVRAEFRLPALTQVPGDFYLHGSRLLIGLDAWPRESTLPLTDDPVLKLPEPAAAAASASAVAPATSADTTVSAQLRARQQAPWVFYSKIAAALVVAAGVGFGAWWALRPPPAPLLLEAQATDDRTVVLTFSTPIDAQTLQPKPAVAGGRAEDPLTFFDDKMKIASRTLSPGAPSRVVIVTEGRLVDGEKYGIAVTRLAPPKGRPIEPSNADFTYYDRTAPKLVTLSAGGKSKKNLILVFSKPAAESSLTPSRFAVFPVDGGQRGKRLNVVGAEFDRDDPSGATVVIEANDDFVGGRSYVIDITGVTDRAAKPNPLTEKSALNREFRYVNVLPPRLGEIVAVGGRFEIALTFNAPVDPALASDEANYTLADSEKKPLRLLKGGIRLDDAGTTVTLRLEPQRLAAGQHHLTVAKMADRQGNVTTVAITRPFAFNDAGDHKPPTLVTVEGSREKGKVTREDRTLRLQFDRALDRESASAAARFRVLDSERRPLALESAAPASDDPARVVVQLASALGGAGQYHVETNALANVFGDVQPAPVSTSFQVLGVSFRAASLIDWAQAPLLRGGGQFLVLTIRPRISEETARNLANYECDPPAVKIQKIESFDLGTEENRVTTVTLRLAVPVREAFSVSVQNLIIEGRKERGPQWLRARSTLIEP